MTQSSTSASKPSPTPSTPSSSSTASTSGTAISPTSDATGSGEKGKTTIAETVVSKIAGIATREVDGVYDLGGGVERVVGALRDRIPGGGSSTNLSQGVSVEVGEKQAAVDLQIIAEYGVALTDLASGIRQNVINSIERMTGLEVTEVNVVVNDVHIADDNAPSTGASAETAQKRADKDAEKEARKAAADDSSDDTPSAPRVH